MFETTYQAELSYLRDMGRAFGRKHPALAGMLAERGTDPDVERLFEGFAFVATRLRERIDDAAPELIETLSELLLPHVLSPIPAGTIVEFRGNCSGERGRTRVERGARLLSRALEGTRCTFTTTRALDILPIRLTRTRLDESVTAHPELTLHFELEDRCEGAVFTRDAMRLHLHGERSITTQLYLWLAQHVQNVRLRISGQPEIDLGPEALQAVGFDPADALLPWPDYAPHGIRPLQEYFWLPQKFMFFDLKNLERAAGSVTNEFEVSIRFRTPPPLGSHLPDDILKLHCVPAVNLFRVDADPVRTDLRERATLLRATGINPHHMEVCFVQSVTGIVPGGERQSYEPFHTFRHRHPGHTTRGFYKLTRQKSPVDGGAHTYLTLHRHDSELQMRSEETLSIELDCTNRSLAQALQIGDIAIATTDTPAGIDFSNITAVTRHRTAPLGDDLLWRFVGHLGCTRRSLANASAIKTLLSLYCTDERLDFTAGRRHAAQIDAIVRIHAETITRIITSCPARGSRYRMELDQAGFASAGEAYLFSAVVHRMLAIDARLNTFADLQARLLPNGITFEFEDEVGS